MRRTLQECQPPPVSPIIRANRGRAPSVPRCGCRHPHRPAPGHTPVVKESEHSGAVRHWTSVQFGYTISIPSGWRQIPTSEIDKFKREHLPTQVQELIWETAFQKDYDGQWFQRPYVVLQITPSSKTKPHRLPTEQDFLVIANDANMHKAAPSKDLREAIAATPNAQAS